MMSFSAGSFVGRMLLPVALATTASLCLLAPAHAAAVPEIPAQVSSADWEADIQRFEAADAAQPPEPGGVLFIGSSSIRFWTTLARDFPDQQVLNRGFGGSQVRDSLWYADRIVVPYAPRLIVLYAGDNDLEAGRSPAQVREDFLAFVTRVRRDLPQVRIAYLAVKPSPARAHLLAQGSEANDLIRHAASRLQGVEFVDVATPMLGADGAPREDLFGPDRLHMNEAGYTLWRGIVAPVLAPR